MPLNCITITRLLTAALLLCSLLLSSLASADRGSHITLDEPLPLSPEQVASWRERGFAVVDGLLPAALEALVAAASLTPLAPLTGRKSLVPYSPSEASAASPVRATW